MIFLVKCPYLQGIFRKWNLVHLGSHGFSHWSTPIFQPQPPASDVRWPAPTEAMRPAAASHVHQDDEEMFQQQAPTKGLNYSTISVNQEKTGSALFACGSTCLILFLCTVIYNVFSLGQTSGTSISSAFFSEVPKTSHVDLHRLTNCLWKARGAGMLAIR